MPFADLDLARRIDGAEQHMLAAAARAADPGARPFALPLGGGLAAFTGVGSPLSKVVGAGLYGPLDEGELAAVEAAYDARGCPVQIEVSTLADPAVGALLTRRGYAWVGFENVLSRALDRLEPPAQDGAVSVAVSPPEELELWLDVNMGGFGAPDPQGVPSHERFEDAALRAVMREFASGPTRVRYLARVDGAAAGAGLVNLASGVAQLCGAATLPAFRRRGVQTRLLAERLAAAARAGSELATMTTLPGSRSQQNAERRGFSLAYGRAILVRPPRA